MNQILNLVRKYWIVISLFTLAGITMLSLWPLDTLPAVPGTDKTHHLVAYAFLMLPGALRKPKRWQWLALFFIGYSGAIELLQPIVNRYAEWLDLAANTAGIGCGIIIGTFANYISAVLQRKSQEF